MNNIHMTLAVSKLKQQISNLQNQIAAQQALYVKQQAAGNHNIGGNGNVGLAAGIDISNIGTVTNAGVGPTANDYLRGQHDPINSLQGSFNEMTMSKVNTFVHLAIELKLQLTDQIVFFLFVFFQCHRSHRIASKIQAVNNRV